jgi:hypothetical protein
MLIAVETNLKTEFDKLWKFTATRMRQSSGLFAWQLSTAGSVMPTNGAPAGDAYFALALRLASRRWGDATGTDYAAEAKQGMRAMLDKGGLDERPAGVTFGPPCNTFTDPSHALRLFHWEWACCDTDHAAFDGRHSPRIRRDRRERPPCGRLPSMRRRPSPSPKRRGARRCPATRTATTRAASTCSRGCI